VTHYTEPKRVESWASAANAKIRLGKISRWMTETGVNIEVLYSDHDSREIFRDRQVTATQLL